MKKFMKATSIIIVILSLCVACGEKNVVKTIEKMYDDGIERVQKAKDAKDVQKIYDDVTQKVKDVKNMHLKEFAELDSATTKILPNAEEKFVKACCIRLHDMGASILKTSIGGVWSDANGNLVGWVKPGEEVVDQVYASKGNDSFNIFAFDPIYEYDKNTNKWYFKEITMTRSINNDYYMYNEEHADYYDKYSFTFYMAYLLSLLAADNDNLREYITNYLTIVLDDMPLDASYSDYVREYVNKIYYDYKDRGPYIGEKRYGYSQYLFRNLMDMKCSFYLRRGEEGRCVIRKY